MAKRGIILAVILAILVFATLVFAAGGPYFYPPGYTTTAPDNVYPYFSQERETYGTAGGSFADAYKLPDLIVSDINVPDQLPAYSNLERVDITVKNIGKGKAEGFIVADVDFSGLNMPSCHSRIYVSGGSTSADPYLSARPMRYTLLYPNQTITVPIYTYGTRAGIPASCQRPLVNDTTIKVTVNPIGGGVSGNLQTRGRLLESDTTNNELDKTIHILPVGSSPDFMSYTLKFVPGMNGFTMPLVNELSASDFIERTGCELFKLPPDLEESQSFVRQLDLGKMVFVPRDETIVPGIAYFARCNYPATLDINGSDPGFFNKTMIPYGFAVAPTRIGMIGRQAYELISGCGSSYSSQGGAGQTKLYSYVPGIQTGNQKMVPESVSAQSKIVPGNLYYAQCGSSYGGYWDAPTTSFKGDRLQPTNEPNYDPFRSRAHGSSDRYPSRESVYGGYTYTWESNT